MSEKSKTLFLVDTVSMYRHRYVIKAENLEHAYDEVTMRASGNEKDYFEEVSQKFISENIVDDRTITKKEFDDLLKKYENNNELSSY